MKEGKNDEEVHKDTADGDPAGDDVGSIHGLGRNSGEGNGNPLKYSCLKNQWTN